MDRLRPILTVAGYGAWFSFVFVLFLWFTFPWGKVSDRLTVDAADDGIAFHADSLRPAIVGAKAKGLIVGPLGRGPTSSPWLQAERLKVKTGLGGAVAALLEVRAISGEGGVANRRELAQRLLGAMGSVRLTGDMYGADVEMEVEDENKEAMRLALDTGRLDLAAYPIPSTLFSGAAQGRLEADADVLWHWEDTKKTSGSVDLEFAGLVLDGIKVVGIGLPTLTFDRAEAHLKMAKGKAEFRNTAFESDVASLNVDGFINLKPNLLASTLSLRVKFKVREDLEGLLSVGGLKKDSRHRDKDGWFHYQGQGRLTRPRFTERRVARSSSSKGKGRVKNGLGEDDGEDEPSPIESRRPIRRTTPDEDEEEPVKRDPMSDDRRKEIEEQRAALREERIKRREERRRKREELLEKRRQRGETGELEDNGRIIRRPSLNEDFERTNDVDVEVEDEGDEGDFEDEGIEEGEGDFGNPDEGGEEFDEGDYEE